MNTELEQLKQQVAELLEWKKQKETQQISFPLDLASKNALGVPYGEGAGTTTKTASIDLTGNAQTITVPAAYVSTFIIVVNGVRYEVPSLI